MYIALFLILIAISVFLFIAGDKKEKRIIKYSGGVLALFT